MNEASSQQNNNTSKLTHQIATTAKFRPLSGVARIEKIEALLETFEGIKRQSSTSWLGLCPAHDDSTPSLSISIDKAKPDLILMHCFAGCTLDQVLGAAHLTFRDLYLNERVEGDR